MDVYLALLQANTRDVVTRTPGKQRQLSAAWMCERWTRSQQVSGNSSRAGGPLCPSLLVVSAPNQQHRAGGWGEPRPHHGAPVFAIITFTVKLLFCDFLFLGFFFF